MVDVRDQTMITGWLRDWRAGLAVEERESLGLVEVDECILKIMFI